MSNDRAAILAAQYADRVAFLEDRYIDAVAAADRKPNSPRFAAIEAEAWAELEDARAMRAKYEAMARGCDERGSDERGNDE